MPPGKWRRQEAGRHVVMAHERRRERIGDAGGPSARALTGPSPRGSIPLVPKCGTLDWDRPLPLPCVIVELGLDAVAVRDWSMGRAEASDVRSLGGMSANRRCSAAAPRTECSRDDWDGEGMR